MGAFTTAPTVLVNAGPWLPVPPDGYGGIERVVAALVPELRRAGWRVVLATVAESTIEADEKVCVYETGQFPRLAAPYGDVVGIALAHMAAVVARLRRRPGIDLVHDHLEAVGPSVLAAMGEDAPPTLQTLHWDLGKHPELYRSFDGGGRVFFAAVSASQLAAAPTNLRAQALDVVPLAAGSCWPTAEPAGDYLLTLGRLTPAKGFDVAARLARRLGVRLVMAGPVGGFADRGALDAALADPASPVRDYRDVQYFRCEVEPLLDGDLVRWVGSVSGEEKDRLLRRARAVVFPLRWDEPGGTAIVEALAAGVPVVGFRRGVLPSLVEHGVTGFVVDTEDELAAALRRVDELDRDACCRGANERFGPRRMAARYLRLYEEVLRRVGVDAPAAPVLSSAAGKANTT